MVCAQAGSAKTSSPAPAARVTTANAPASGSLERRGDRPPVAPESSAAPASATTVVSSRPRSTSGDCAAAQPAMTAATASAAEARAGPNRSINTSTMVTTPASALTITSASPSPLVSPCHSDPADARITSSPARAGNPMRLTPCGAKSTAG
jgi:hypothetical protein